MGDSAPALYTVEEAAKLLRVGRTKAYALTREWRATGGRSGLPVVDFGNILRVPRAALEQMLGVDLAGDSIGLAATATVPAAEMVAEPQPAPADVEPGGGPAPAEGSTVKPRIRPRAAAAPNGDQLGLFDAAS